MRASKGGNKPTPLPHGTSVFDMRASMAAITDASDVLALLLEGGHSTIAGRIAGAFRSAGQEGIADDIVKTMEKAGYTVRESNPFADAPPAVLQTREPSPYVNRVRLMWQAMRDPVLAAFPASSGSSASPRCF